MHEVGVMASLQADGPSLQYVREFGLKVCQLVSWNEAMFTPELGDAIRIESQESGVRVTSFWAGWPGPAPWDFVEGPMLLGLVPREYRRARIDALKKAGVFAKSAAIPAVVTHVGFVPESLKDPLFEEMVEATREIATALSELGLDLWFETGQETPVTLLRLINAVGTGNLGVNLDPANLILYGKGNPVDSLDVIGKYVKGVHAKDGLYPQDPMKLGSEVKVGAGRVRFPTLVGRLKEIGYAGDFIIEREISGAQQIQDIRETIAYLGALIRGESRPIADT